MFLYVHVPNRQFQPHLGCLLTNPPPPVSSKPEAEPALFHLRDGINSNVLGATHRISVATKVPCAGGSAHDCGETLVRHILRSVPSMALFAFVGRILEYWPDYTLQDLGILAGSKLTDSLQHQA